jgi:hypothetical protein
VTLSLASRVAGGRWTLAFALSARRSPTCAAGHPIAIHGRATKRTARAPPVRVPVKVCFNPCARGTEPLTRCLSGDPFRSARRGKSTGLPKPQGARRGRRLPRGSRAECLSPLCPVPRAGARQEHSPRGRAECLSSLCPGRPTGAGKTSARGPCLKRSGSFSQSRPKRRLTRGCYSRSVRGARAARAHLLAGSTIATNSSPGSHVAVPQTREG